jgi:hypothetical protein
MDSNVSKGHTASVLRAIVMGKYLFVGLVVKKFHRETGNDQSCSRIGQRNMSQGNLECERNCYRRGVRRFKCVTSCPVPTEGNTMWRTYVGVWRLQTIALRCRHRRLRAFSSICDNRAPIKTTTSQPAKFQQ